MSLLFTSYDWLVFSGLAVNCIAFWLMFRPQPEPGPADSLLATKPPTGG